MQESAECRGSGKSKQSRMHDLSLHTSKGATIDCSTQEMFQVAGMKHELKPHHLFQYGEARLWQITYVEMG